MYNTIIIYFSFGFALLYSAAHISLHRYRSIREKNIAHPCLNGISPLRYHHSQTALHTLMQGRLAVNQILSRSLL